MKKIIIIFITLFITQNSFAQSDERIYPFDVEIIGNGDPVILIPGLTCDGAVWNATVNQLKETYECHVLTLAGFSNQAPIEFGDAYLPSIQKGIIDYIKKELDEKPILIGHSLGGFTSLAIASNEADLLKQIVIVDSYPFYTAAMMPMATEASAKPQAEQLKTMLISTPDEAFAQQQKMTMASMASNPAEIDLAVQWSIDSDRETMAQAMYEIMTTDLRDEVAAVKCPILVFGSWYGAKDYGITKEMVEINYQNQFSKASNCTIKVADTAKHFVMWDEPIWFHENLVAFLQK